MTPEAKRLSEALREDAEYLDNYVGFVGSQDRIVRNLLAAAEALSLPDQPDAARAGVRELDDDQIMEIIKEVAPWRDEPKLNDLLTYEKSPPLFPQATYDVPSYRATKFVRAVERRILSALVPEPSPAQADGLRAAIQWVEKRRDDYVAEHGSYDPETGATEFPGNGDEYVGELEEIIEGLEALRPAPKQFLATEDGEFNGNAPAQADERVVEALREGAALVRQLSAVIHRLNGQAYSSTLSQLNAFKAKLAALPSPAAQPEAMAQATGGVDVNGRDIYEVSNQLGGYVDQGTPDDLAEFLIRESKAACDLADEIVRLRAALSRSEPQAAPVSHGGA